MRIGIVLSLEQRTSIFLFYFVEVTPCRVEAIGVSSRSLQTMIGAFGLYCVRTLLSAEVGGTNICIVRRSCPRSTAAGSPTQWRLEMSLNPISGVVSLVHAQSQQPYCSTGMMIRLCLISGCISSKGSMYSSPSNAIIFQVLLIHLIGFSGAWDIPLSS